MRIPWRDGIATLFVAAALGLYLAFELDRPVPGFAAVAPVAIAVLLLGIAASASAVVPGFAELLRGSRLYLLAASALGVVAFGMGLWGVLANREEALLAFVLATLVLWAMSTLRHLTVLRSHGALGSR